MGWFKKNFVWWSDRASIEAEKISILAVCETVFSVAAYWWIAWYFDTYLHLLISICVAPLVLLRSPESVALGLEWWGKFQISSEEKEPLPRWFFCILALILTTLIYMSGIVDSGWKGALIAAFLGANAAMCIVMIFHSRAYRAFFDNRIEWAIVGICTLAGLGAGFSINTIFIRIGASVKCLDTGVLNYTKNWLRLLALTDVCFSPETLPDVSKSNPSENLYGLIKLVFEDTSPLVGVAVFVFVGPVIAIAFLPAILYRYSLKSTCWLYLPLIYISSLPANRRDPQGRLVWVKSILSKPMEWLRVIGSGLTLALALVALAEPTATKHLMNALQTDALPFTPLTLIFILDWGQVQPWQWFTLPSAILTLILFAKLSTLRGELKHGGVLDPEGWQLRGLLLVDRLRNGLVLCWVGVALYYTAGYLYGCSTFPDWLDLLARGFALIYGVQTCG